MTFDLNKIIELDSDKKRTKFAQHKELKLADYLNLLKEDPKIAQNSPSRLLEIILAGGMENIPEEERWLGVDKRYPLIANTLFGVEKTTADFLGYLKAGAARLSTGKQILLFVGPTASGKSTLVNILKHALESYSTRPVFMIKGCPMLGEPLHLLPRYMREQVMLKPEECENCKGEHLHLGVKIEGDLCTHCRHNLEQNFTDPDGRVRWWDVPVSTFTFSIQGTRGIGSFEPSDSKSSDVTDLVGRVNIAQSSVKGSGHPLAYDLNGELEKANRGICEGRELIKADEKLLWVFISVAEEKELKVQGSPFPHISVDTVVIGHTNLTEYKKFATRQENEALHDRMYVVACPYPLRVNEEVKIYKKLIQKESDFAKLASCHIAPDALQVAAIFAVLTRLTDSQMGVDKMTKLKVYNGDIALTELQDKEKRPVDKRHLYDEGQTNPDISKREGMFGVSSRDVLAALNTAVVQQSDLGGCLTTLKVVRALREVFEHRMGYTPEEIDRFKNMLSAGEGGNVMSEIKDLILRLVSKAFLKAYDDLARELFNKYIEEVRFYRTTKRKHVRGQMLDLRRDEATGKLKEPDIKFMRSIEEQMHVSESEADTVRGEILEYKEAHSEFGYDTYLPLAKAVEKKLLQDSRSSLSLVLAQDKPKGEEEKKRINDLFGALKEMGHCEICAREKVEKAREFLSE